MSHSADMNTCSYFVPDLPRAGEPVGSSIGRRVRCGAEASVWWLVDPGQRVIGRCTVHCAWAEDVHVRLLSEDEALVLRTMST